MFRIKRTYDRPARGDGRRILVERLWPRGLTKGAVAADARMKDVAPSTELRKWFDHRKERWEEFRGRYRNELDANPRGWEPILEAARRGAVTLLYSAHDAYHNGALVLRDYLAEREAEEPVTRGAGWHRRTSGTAGQGSARRRGTHASRHSKTSPVIRNRGAHDPTTAKR
jgi:uncharacterized protein YeaO (DUF488 family)